MIFTGRTVFFIKNKASPNIAADATGAPSSDLNFALAVARPGVPGINDPGDRLTFHRDWTQNFAIPNDGFAAIRWNPSWIRTTEDQTIWQHANADIYRIQRKGTVGADLQTLVFTCSPNTHAIPAGEPVVIWDSTTGDDVVQNTSHSLSGFALPTRSKLNVTACTPSAMYDVNGRRLIEINMATDLPVIDFSPTFFGGKSTMQLRHWRFYANTATKDWRNPLKSMMQITKSNALANNGYIILGGNKFAPTGYDWSQDYSNFGATLVEELFRLECEGLANEFGATDPRRLAVELEDYVTRTWATVGAVPGYRTLLNDVFYPIARTAWGQDRTIIVKGSGGFAGLTGFDWRPPAGHNVHLAVHTNDTNITIDTIAQTDSIGDQIKDKITALGFRGGGITSLAVTPGATMDIKGQRLGRMLTSLTNDGLYVFYYASLGTEPATTNSVADVFVINGARVEAVLREIAPLASRAGLVFE